MTDPGPGHRDQRVEDLLRVNAPQVLGALVRRYGNFDSAEDAVQEALLAAAVQWPKDGVPDSPRGWLIKVAARRLTDQLRSEEARRKRETTAQALIPHYRYAVPGPDESELPPRADDTLTLLVLCCHPALTPASQIALTLRAVGGLTTAEIAHAFLVPEPTMAQRISRAKQRIKTSGTGFGEGSRGEESSGEGPSGEPSADELDERLGPVLHVLYLIFNEGYTASAGDALHRADLAREAIRLTRAVHRLRPADTEAAGLLALMLLTDARRPARTLPDGSLVPLADQDRGRWLRAPIEEGVELITSTLVRRRPGPYQLQAAIAAVHDEAATPEDTDWPQIVALYEYLERLDPNPVIRLNHAVALAMTKGPETGLRMLDGLEADERLAGFHRLAAVRAHLLEMTGDLVAAATAYRQAAAATRSLPERRYLSYRAIRCAPD